MLHLNSSPEVSCKKENENENEKREKEKMGRGEKEKGTEKKGEEEK